VEIGWKGRRLPDRLWRLGQGVKRYRSMLLCLRIGGVFT
jgi:hypothetical protein